jgi:hypothetical protein
MSCLDNLTCHFVAVTWHCPFSGARWIADGPTNTRQTQGGPAYVTLRERGFRRMGSPERRRRRPRVARASHQGPAMPPTKRRATTRALLGASLLHVQPSAYLHVCTPWLFAQEVLSPLPWPGCLTGWRKLLRGTAGWCRGHLVLQHFGLDLIRVLQGLDAELAANMTCSIMY